MPEGQEPTQSGVNIVKSTENLKVYFKLDPADDWEIDKSLICFYHSKTKGSKIGKAQFTTLMFDNDTDSSDWQETNAAMRYNAAVKYQVDVTDGYKTPYLVRVTDNTDGIEKTVWYGYISKVDQDHKEERVAIMGLTYAGLMDQQQIMGGWYLTNDKVIVDYFKDWKPVYNPKNIGNKSTKQLDTSTNATAWGIDNTLIKETQNDFNLWKAEDIIDQVIARGISHLFDDTDNKWNPWRWMESLYTHSPLPVAWTTEISAILANSSPVSNYTMQGKTLWGVLVEVVESIDGLTISEDIDKFDRPYITVVNLKV